MCWTLRPISVCNQPATLANSAFHPSRVCKWVPASAGKAKAGMVHPVSGWTRGCAGKTEIPWERVPYSSALEVWSRQGAIQIHVYLTVCWVGYCTSRYHNDTFAWRRCFNAAVSGGKRCRAVEDVKHGSWEPSGRRSYRLGSIIRYWCDEGYSLYGPVERECQENGTWTDTSPSCRISGSYIYETYSSCSVVDPITADATDDISLLWRTWRTWRSTRVRGGAT